MSIRRVISFACLALAIAASAGLAQQSPPGPSSPAAPPAAQRPKPTRFEDFDQNHDGAIGGAELTEDTRARDRNRDGRVTREEFNRPPSPPWYSDVRTVAALLLVGAFAAFCMFLDGLLEPERRDYFWSSLVGSLLLAALAYLCASGWFFREAPHLAYVLAVPALVIVAAILAGATREQEEVAAPTGPVVYTVGNPAARTPAATPAGAAPRPGAAPARRPAAFGHKPRPAPLPRPAIPERRPPTAPGSEPVRPQGTGGLAPPRPQPPASAQPPRPKPPGPPPPRPPGPPPKPGSGPKPPGKT